MNKITRKILIAVLSVLFLASCETEPEVPRTYSEIYIEALKSEVETGEEIALEAKAEDGRTLHDIAWSISDENLASIIAEGSSATLEAVKGGTLKVTATESVTGKKASFDIVVIVKPLPDVAGPYGFSVSGQVYDEETGSLRDFRDLDRILLSAKGKDGSVTGYVLAVSGSGEWWLFDEDGRVQAEIDGSLTESITAYYAPSYELRNGSPERKISYSARPGAWYSGDEEFLSTEAVIDRKRGVIEIGFTGNNSVLVLEMRPHTRIRVNITDFSASDGEEDATAPGGYSETILTGDGKVTIHGSWKEGSRIQVIWAEYGELKEAFLGDMPEMVEGSVSTLVVDIPEGDIAVTKPFVSAMIYGGESSENHVYPFPGAVNQSAWHLCWAASSSQLINWWAWQNSLVGDAMIRPDGEQRPVLSKDDYDNRSGDIFGFFSKYFQDRGFDPIPALRWFFAGEHVPDLDNMLRPGNTYDGFFRETPHIEDLVWDFDENYVNHEYSADPDEADERYRNFSRVLYGTLEKGNPLVMQNHEHAFTVWGAYFDVATGLVTGLRVTDSNGGYAECGPYSLGSVGIKLKDARIVINPVHDDSDGTVHAENDDPFTTMATLVRNFGSLEYITD